MFTGGRLRGLTRAAEHEAEAAVLLAEQEAAEIAFEVRLAYWSLYQAMAVRDAVGAALRQVDEHLASCAHASRLENGG